MKVQITSSIRYFKCINVLWVHVLPFLFTFETRSQAAQTDLRFDVHGGLNDKASHRFLCLSGWFSTGLGRIRRCDFIRVSLSCFPYGYLVTCTACQSQLFVSIRVPKRGQLLKQSFLAYFKYYIFIIYLIHM